MALEKTAMIKEELTPGREAILFLNNEFLFLNDLGPGADTAHADLLYRVYDTSTRVKLDDLEKLIAAHQTLETDF